MSTQCGLTGGTENSEIAYFNSVVVKLLSEQYT